MSTREVGQDQGRKPASLHSTEARGQSYGQQAIWEEIRRQGTFTKKSLWLEIDKRRAGNWWTIRSYVERLEKGGYIEVVDIEQYQGNAFAYTFKLVHDCGVECPRLKKDGSPCTQGLAREQCWRTMKILGDFSPRDLAINASTEEVPVSEAYAKDYIKYLHKADYLHMTQDNKGGHSQARYRLIPRRWTGPQPPQVQHSKVVYDPNNGEVKLAKEVRDDRE